MLQLSMFHLNCSCVFWWCVVCAELWCAGSHACVPLGTACMFLVTVAVHLRLASWRAGRALYCLPGLGSAGGELQLFAGSGRLGPQRHVGGSPLGWACRD